MKEESGVVYQVLPIIITWNDVEDEHSLLARGHASEEWIPLQAQVTQAGKGGEDSELNFSCKAAVAELQCV